MNNRMKNRLVLGSATGLTVLGVSVPAFADSVSDAVSSLNNGANVYVDRSSTGVPDGIDSVYQGTDIAVVFLPESSNTHADAYKILQSTDKSYDAVIVSVNGRSFAAATGDSAVDTQLTQYLNTNGADSLVSDLSEVSQLTTTTTTTDNSTDTLNVSAGDIPFGVFVVMGLAVLAVSIFLVRKIFTSSPSSDSSKDKSSFNFDKIDEGLAEQMEELHSVISRLKENNLTDGYMALTKLENRLGEFFKRVKIKGTSDQMMTSAVEYRELLKKIVYIMDEHHYMDVVQNPELWNNADVRKENSLAAVRSLDAQVLDNIRRLNDSQNLDFNVAMQALMQNNSDDLDSLKDLIVKDDKGFHNTLGG